MPTGAIESPSARPAIGTAEAAAARTEALPHMTQLDAVRTIAILGVMAFHFFDNPVTHQGSQGVTLFFVLSGFLITGILIQCRQYVERDGQSRLFTLRQFYIRRFLRIFPLYYVVLGVLFLLHNQGVRASFGWHLAYLTNVKLSLDAARNLYPDWSVGHFWSLAVEEQFYLVWPWVVLFLSRRNLVRAVVLLACAGPAFRFIALALHVHILVIDRLPFFYLDALGIGALLAVASDPAFGLRPLLARARPVALVAGLLMIATAIYFEASDRHFTFRQVIYFLGYSLVSGWLVSRAAAGFGGIAGRVMSWRPIVWLGAISYGIYVFHYILRAYSITLSLPAMHPLLRGTLLGAASILLAAASFYSYERPINRLRRFFPYRVKSRPTGSNDAVPLKQPTPFVR